ncbi:MAG: hypothetical protein HY978_01195 [Candidatus Liptonbacteria bacterium]|nr:hypothetical protein [Candidatus Liptonbacteria bacterium]
MPRSSGRTSPEIKRTPQLEAHFASAKKRRARWRCLLRRMAIAAIAVLILVGAIWAAVRSPAFRLRQIITRGNTTVTADQVQSVLQSQILSRGWLVRVLGSENLLVWPTRFTPEQLALLPVVSEVKANKDYLDRKIELTVVERQPLGVWCQEIAKSDPRYAGGFGEARERGARSEESADNLANSLDSRQFASCWWFDKEGFIIRPASYVEGGLILIVHDSTVRPLGVGHYVLPSKLMLNLLAIAQAVTDANLTPRALRVQDIALEEVEMILMNGPKLLFSLRLPAPDVAAVIHSVADKSDLQSLEYVDFRVEGKVYYK